MKKILFLLMMSFFISLTPVNAKEGDFYNKYKSEFSESTYIEQYIELLKVYDMQTNTFNCGMIDFYCHSQGTQISLAVGFMKFAFTGTDNLILNPQWILEEPIFKKFKGYFDSMTTSMLILFLVWQILVGYMKRIANLEDVPDLLNQKLLGVFGGAAFLALYDEIFSIIMDLQYDISGSILKFGVDYEHFLLVTFKYGPIYSFLFVYFIGLIFLVFLIALVYRFVALGFSYVVGPVAITTIVNEEFNYFNLWLKYIVNNVITFFLQCLAFSIAVGCLSLQFNFIKNLPTGVEIVVAIIVAVVSCLFALVVPGILGNLGASTGTGRSIGKVLRYVALKK